MPEQESKKPVDHSQLGVIYANDKALEGIGLSLKTFPVGSIFVREKLSPTTSKPELLAVMIKRESGFNPEASDWQFLLTDGNKKKVKLNQKTGECLNCHWQKKESDFVFPVRE